MVVPTVATVVVAVLAAVPTTAAVAVHAATIISSIRYENNPILGDPIDANQY
jgi:hypothetical protein